jgi:hypothetical protein
MSVSIIFLLFSCAIVGLSHRGSRLFFGAGTNVACLKLGRPFRALPFVKKRAKVAAVRLNNSYFIKLLRFSGNKNPPTKCSAGGFILSHAEQNIISRRIR